MNETNHMNDAALPPHAQLIQMATAAFVSKVVYVAARVRLADYLSEGPQSATELAGPMGLHAPTLHRLLRTLGGLGIVTELEAQRFELTDLGRALASDAPGCARSSIVTLGGRAFSAAFEELEHCMATGETGFVKAHGMPIFDYFAQNPDDAQLFSETMVGFHGAEPPAVAACYDFSGFESIVDIGGATGNLLAAILGRHAGPRGVLFDLPHVVEGAPALLESHGIAERVSIEAGNFFDEVPAGGDAYVLSHIIHDWSEDQCLTILGNCRRVMGPTGRLLLVEMVLPSGDVPHPGKILDMVMLAIPGGRERTETEYDQLLAKAGFRLARVVPTNSAVSIVEAIPA